MIVLLANSYIHDQQYNTLDDSCGKKLNLYNFFKYFIVTKWIKMVVLYFIVNVINNASFKFNIAMPLYMIFKSVSISQPFFKYIFQIDYPFHCKILYRISMYSGRMLVNNSFLFSIQGSLAASLMTEKLVLGRTHSRLKHLAVFLITVGIMMYTYASSKQVPEHISIFDWIAGTYVISFKFQRRRYSYW